LENAALPLAEVPGIDVVLAGHTHDVFPSDDFPASASVDPAAGRLHGKPAVMAGHHGQNLGVIDLHLALRDGQWRIRDGVSAVRRSSVPQQANTPAQSAIEQALHAPHTLTRKWMNEHLINALHPISSRFTMLGHDQTIALTAKAHREAVSALVADGPFAAFPVIGAASSFRAGGHGGAHNFLDLAPGPLARRDAYAISPFNNPVCAVLRRGWQIQQWLEHAAGYFQRIPPGAQNAPLLSSDFPAYQFDWLIGLTYQFDLSHPARFDRKGALLNPQAQRVRNIQYNGHPIAEDDLFVVTTNVYRARGGGGYVPVPDADIIGVTQEGATTILQNALTQNGVPAPDGPNWRFARNAGATAQFLSSPLGHGTLPDDNITHLGPADAGFDAYQIAL
jgi:2',3'-cyclic-nucleotide 2'-phosphodiesterase/3'-nucleotidase